MLELINKIRANPSSYADIVENSIKNIIKVYGNDKNNPKIIYKHKVKVALAKGELAFGDAVKELRNMESLPPLEYKREINKIS